MPNTCLLSKRKQFQCQITFCSSYKQVSMQTWTCANAINRHADDYEYSSWRRNCQPVKSWSHISTRRKKGWHMFLPNLSPSCSASDHLFLNSGSLPFFTAPRLFPFTMYYFSSKLLPITYTNFMLLTLAKKPLYTQYFKAFLHWISTPKQCTLR